MRKNILIKVKNIYYKKVNSKINNNKNFLINYKEELKNIFHLAKKYWQIKIIGIYLKYKGIIMKKINFLHHHIN